MNGTNVQRVVRIGVDLLRHPNLCGAYLKTLPLWKKQPLDYAIPWYSYTAIYFLNTYLSKEMTVFEYGGGGSTLFYAERCKHVFCVESCNSWADRIEEVLKQKGITNVSILRCPLDGITDAPSFKESAYCCCVKNIDADVYVIDGYEAEEPFRPQCFTVVEDKIKPSNLIVLDDSWRYENIRNTHHAKKMNVFQSIGPCRYGVTSTDVYFY